jgi:hypothetical protein
MNKHIVLRALVATVAVAAATPALAQEHWTEGPVWSCDRYRVKEGQNDAYARYLRSTVVPQTDAMKKAGLMVDRLYFIRSDGPGDGWNYMSCIVDKNFAAFDYDAARDKKADEIAAAQLKTADKAKQAEATGVRFGMRDFVGSTTIREVVLKPLP